MSLRKLSGHEEHYAGNCQSVDVLQIVPIICNAVLQLALFLNSMMDLFTVVSGCDKSAVSLSYPGIHSPCVSMISAPSSLPSSPDPDRSFECHSVCGLCL